MMQSFHVSRRSGGGSRTAPSATGVFLTMVMLLVVVLAACQNGQQEAPPEPYARSTALDVLLASDLQPMDQVPTPVPDMVIAEADAEYLLLTNIYERSAPSVVNIEVVVIISRQGNLVDTGHGSGFVYDQDGHIVTNAHVVKNAREIYVTFDDGYVTEAQVIGIDVFSDIAVIKVDTDSARLVPLVLADSERVRVGERAIAIGNPFGLSSSMTVGIVSGIGRQLPSAELVGNPELTGFQNPHIIQVDTQINPGNSGGPLLNSHGEVIGVNTAITTDSGVFQGVGFAVPSNTVGRVVPELIRNGRVDYSWIGITTVSSEEISLAAMQEPLDLPVDAGVLITGVTPGSPAAEAGLRAGGQLENIRGRNVCAGGDIIIAVDGHYIENMDELVAYLIIETVPGDTVTLLIVRDGVTFDVPVTLRVRPEEGVVVPQTCGE